MDSYVRKKGIIYKNQFHVIFCPKYRRKVLVDGIDTRLKEILYDEAKKMNVDIKALEVMPDHVHILFDAPPQINLANFVNAYKSASSRLLKKNFLQQLEPYYWKPYFWSNSYFIGSVSDESFKTVQNYIDNQK